MTTKREKSPGDSRQETGSRAPTARVRVPQLLHELQVHSEEIAAQNEQLLRAQRELEEARDRYADLYDFAPIGYLSLDTKGVIHEINIAAAALLGLERRFALGMPLLGLIASDHRERLTQFLRDARVANTATASLEIDLKIGRVVRLVVQPADSRPVSRLLTAILDVTAERLLEIERTAAHARELERSAQLVEENAVRISAEERVKALLERLVTVQEQERRRLGLNVHDQLGQQVTTLRLALAALRETKEAEFLTRLDAVEEIVTQLDRDVDLLAWELRPAALDDVGLEAALSQFVASWSARHQIQAEFHGPQSDERLPTHVENHLYRITQEALNNVVKHARATHVSVLLGHRTGKALLIIEDDGCGFSLEKARRERAGMGLIGMEERSALIGATVQFETAPGKGTTLFLKFP